MYRGSSYKNAWGGEDTYIRKVRRSKNGGLGWWIALAVIYYLLFI